MNQQFTSQQIISVNQAKSRLSELTEEAAKDKSFFLTKGGKLRAVLVGAKLWLKVSREIQNFTQRTFIGPQTLPFTRLFSDKEIENWLKEDKLTSKQREIIQKGNAET